MGSTRLASCGVPARFDPPASVQHCTGQPHSGHEYYEPGMTREVYVATTYSTISSRVLVAIAIKIPGPGLLWLLAMHAPPGSTRLALREVPV